MIINTRSKIYLEIKNKKNSYDIGWDRSWRDNYVEGEFKEYLSIVSGFIYDTSGTKNLIFCSNANIIDQFYKIKLKLSEDTFRLNDKSLDKSSKILVIDKDNNLGYKTQIMN